MKPTLLGLAFKAPSFHPQPAFPASSPLQLGFFPNIHTSPSQPWAFPPAAPSAWDALPPHFSSKLQFHPLEVPQDFPAEDIISVLHSYRPWAQELPFCFTTSITVPSRLAARGMFLTLTATKWLEHSQEAAAGSGRGRAPGRWWGDGDTDTGDQGAGRHFWTC